MFRIVGIAVALLALAVTGSSAAADTGLVGQWHLDEGTGTVAADSSGHGNHGTVLGGAQWVPGRFGAALSFEGTTARVQVANSASLEPASAVSVSAWVKRAGSPGDYRYILAKGATGCISASYALYSGPNGGLAFYVSNGHGSSYVLSPDAGSRVWDGNWHLVVGTFDGSTVRLFVDGSEVGSGTPHSAPIGYLLTNSNDLFIGDYPGCRAHSFLGVIDEVMVWSRALTPAEVSATMPPPAQGPPAAGGHPTPTGQPVSGQTGQPSTQRGHRSNPPALGRLSVSPSAFPAASNGRRLAGKRRTAATISYTDTQAARSTFTVLLPQPGVARAGRCVKPPKENRGKHTRRCVRYLALGRFTHADSAGPNRFHFTSLAGLKLAPHRYRLDATPSAHGQTGRTVSTTFTIIR